MPKRLNVNLEQVADWKNVTTAVCSAAKGKRSRREVRSFFRNYDSNVESICKHILSATLCHGSYRAFTIQDPKPRIIHAASFEDRIIHHALIQGIGERLERSWVDSSYACRKSMGSHRAVEKAAQLCRRYSVVAKLDIRAYFASIDNKVLEKLLARQIKGDGVFRLIHHILCSFSNNGLGLPIGALTSQYFANHYLDGFQRWLQNCDRVQAELRYMDDMLVFFNSIEEAKTVVKDCYTWLENQRNLKLKPAIVQSCETGMNFCGFKVSAEGIRLSKRRKRSYTAQLKKLCWHASQNKVSPLSLQQTACQLASLCVPGDHRAWQLSQLEKIKSAYNLEV